jgi:thiamine-monophosphate kinase
MTEFELIARLKPTLPTNAEVVVGAGDDCAVLACGDPERDLLLKTDAVVEGIHFTKETPPEKVGRKALARCLSDIAAMAGTPSAAVVTLGLPKDYSVTVVEKIYAGLGELARAHGVAIVGGETTTSPERLFLSVALTGYVAKGKAILRSGARAGDALFVTGELGGSLAGKHLDFEPRLAEACWLAKHFNVHAMLDLSDGLAGDLRHLLQPAGLGAELGQEVIPVSRAAKLAARERTSAKPPALAALTDGEDFELLFAVAAAAAVRLKDAWKEQFPKLKLTCIGKLTAEPGLRLRDKFGVRPFKGDGYVHFA